MIEMGIARKRKTTFYFPYGYLRFALLWPLSVLVALWVYTHGKSFFDIVKTREVTSPPSLEPGYSRIWRKLDGGWIYITLGPENSFRLTHSITCLPANTFVCCRHWDEKEKFIPFVVESNLKGAQDICEKDTPWLNLCLNGREKEQADFFQAIQRKLGEEP